MDNSRLEAQLNFLIEIDKLKRVLRRSWICRGERKENSAEHSWHAALMVFVLAEYSNTPIDAVRTAKIMLVHDLVEIDAGDTFIYDSAGAVGQRERENRAADRIFPLLPVDQATEFRLLWEEFEDSRTPEAKFAKAVDRMLPLLHNFHSWGKSWREHGIDKSRVLEINGRIGAGSSVLWEYAREIIGKAAEQGFLTDDPQHSETL